MRQTIAIRRFTRRRLMLTAGSIALEACGGTDQAALDRLARLESENAELAERVECSDFWDTSPRDSQTLERTIDLGSEEVHCFSRTIDSQSAVLEEFVSTCLSQTTYETAQQEADWGRSPPRLCQPASR